MPDLFSIEICAGGGGQALGLEAAGFRHVALIELDEVACATLQTNRPSWSVIRRDVRELSGKGYRGVDLLCGGVPCPPFSFAGHQLGADDDRDLFPEALRLVREAKPQAVMLENVRGFASHKFISYRRNLLEELETLGYHTDWRVLEASRFGIPQLRPRFVLVALRPKAFARFRWPEGNDHPNHVGAALGDLMASRGWRGASNWVSRAAAVGPTVVGGSRKHGGPDLGPTRARRQWAALGVDGAGIVAEPPDDDFPAEAMPRLTNRMVARLQGFPDSWHFVGKKTAAYRQIGNAFPPPVAQAVGQSIAAALGRVKDIEQEAMLQLTA